jgi:hypothetical protein
LRDLPPGVPLWGDPGRFGSVRAVSGAEPAVPSGAIAAIPTRDGRVQGVMRAAPRPESVGEAEEVGLVDRTQHLLGVAERLSQGTILRNRCSRSIGIGVQDASEYAAQTISLWTIFGRRTANFCQQVERLAGCIPEAATLAAVREAEA